ncbi:MAG TPA: shikimate dehydrogenase [Nitrospiria bacterium]
MAITGRTQLTGIVGYPVGHSLSPAMQNAAFEALGLDYCYIPLNVAPARLGAVVQSLRDLGFRGFNVTIPHKESIGVYLDRLTPEARLIGAVNTVENRRGRLIGHNTDGRGFLASLKEDLNLNVRDRKILILGAGGAARAVAFQAALEGASLLLANRTRSRVKALARDLVKKIKGVGIISLSWSEKALREAAGQADIIVNATSVGMKTDDPALLPKDSFRPDQIVCDLVYRPLDTVFLTQARLSGARTVNGLGMLAHQGALSFEIWTDRKPPLLVMTGALKKALEGRETEIP